jgi:hypothetical protein
VDLYRPILPAENDRRLAELSRDFEAGGQHRFPGGVFQLPAVVLLTEFSHPPSLSQGPAVLEWPEALMLFHEMGQLQTAELLRLSGADPNVQCYNGNTPLHFAACHGDVEMVQVLLNLEAHVNIRNNSGRTPLNYISIGPYQAPTKYPITLNRWPMSLDYCLTVVLT